MNDIFRYAAACEDCEFSVESTDESAIRTVVAGHAKRREHESFYVVLHNTNPEAN